MTDTLYHCCVVDIDGFGILLQGPSGSGKTSLMFGLQEYLSRNGISAQIVCDDYAVIQSCNGNVEARAPDNIKGKAEVRGYGIVDVSCKSDSVPLGLLVQLVDPNDVERMPEGQVMVLLGHTLQTIKVPRCHENGAIRIILAWLRDNTDINLPSLGS